MNIFNLRFNPLILLLCSLVATSTLNADDFKKNKGFKNIELGLLAAKGRTLLGSTTLELTEVRNGALKLAGLKVGDKIISANGIQFSKEKAAEIRSTKKFYSGNEPREAFGRELWNSAHSSKKLLTLKYLRNGSERITLVSVPKYPGSKVLLSKICDEIACEKYTGKYFPSVISEAICGLVLMASGDQKYANAVEKKADFYTKLCTKQRHRTKRFQNWQLAHIGIFLAEYYLATGNKKTKPALIWLSHTLALNTRGTGQLCHGTKLQPTYAPNGMTAIESLAVLVWNLVEKSGLLTNPVDIAARNKSTELLLETMHPKIGAIDYGKYKGTTFSDSQGRSANYALSQMVGSTLKKNKGDIAAKWLVIQKHKLLFGHAGTFFSFWSSMSVLYTCKPEGWKDAVKAYNWYRALSSRPLDSKKLLQYLPSRMNNGGDHYIDSRRVAQANTGILMALSCGCSKLHIHGGRKRNWFIKKSPLKQ